MRVNIIIPIYKNQLSNSEKVSFKVVQEKLSHYPITLVVPKNLDTSAYIGNHPKISVEFFHPNYFKGIEAYNRLLLSKEFYKRFETYEYILIYQLDALVFSNHLESWCKKGYDYIGAPWIKESLRIFLNVFFKVSVRTSLKLLFTKKINNAVGNGGFSLRKVSSFLNAFDENKIILSSWNANEDYFWSFFATSKGKPFKKPIFFESLKFSIETHPQKAYKLIKNQIPFGTHAWEKIDKKFWDKLIKEKAYLIPQEKKHPPHFKLSLITVTYNCKKDLIKTLVNFEKQQYNNTEIIIVDGGSSDGTKDIIMQFDSCISKWVSEPDSGIYDAMNKGLKMATGDYVWFINAGDEIYSTETIKKMFSVNPGADVYYGDTMIIDKERNEIGLRRLKPTKKLTWRSFQMGQMVSHQAFVAKRELSTSYNLNYKHSADIDWQIKILKKSNVIVDTQSTLCKFLDGGKSKQNILPSIKERFVIMKYNYGLLKTILNHFLIATKFFLFTLRNRRF